MLNQSGWFSIGLVFALFLVVLVAFGIVVWLVETLTSGFG
jgi:hypothetical protein